MFNTADTGATGFATMKKPSRDHLSPSNLAGIRFGLQNLGVVEVDAFGFGASTRMRLQLIHLWPWRIHTWPQPESMVFSLLFGMN